MDEGTRAEALEDDDEAPSGLGVSPGRPDSKWFEAYLHEVVGSDPEALQALCVRQHKAMNELVRRRDAVGPAQVAFAFVSGVAIGAAATGWLCMFLL